MWTCGSTNPQSGKPCGTTNPDDVTTCAACGASKPEIPPAPPVKFRWIAVVSVASLLLCILLGAVLPLSLKLTFNASLEGFDIPDRISEPDMIPGEIRETTLTTNYKAVFVPKDLTENRSEFAFINTLYSPMLMSGVPIVLKIPRAPESGGDFPDLFGVAVIRYSSFFVPVIFAVVVFALMFAFDLLVRDRFGQLKFLAGIVVTWLVYSFIITTIGAGITGSLDGFLNSLLAEEQRPADFIPTIGPAYLPAIRIIIYGKIYWVITLLIKKARESEKPAPADS